MKNRIMSLLCLILVCFAILRPVCAKAAEPLNPEANARLTLHYQKDGLAFEGLQISIYRVAQAFPDGTFGLIAPFSSYPVNIHGITAQQQWNHVATTLTSYIVANQVAADYVVKTDEQGIAQFTDLQTGLYLVREVIAEVTEGTYIFNQFMVYLPTPLPDGTYDYDIDAKPKCINYIPKSQYTVTKLWQDAGIKADRPDEVIVDIYKNGELQETQILRADNNWSYTWYVPNEDQSIWTVAERSVLEPYTVTIQQNGNVFSIINATPTKPTPPQTADSFTLLPVILIMCVCGIALMLMGIHSRRRQ